MIKMKKYCNIGSLMFGMMFCVFLIGCKSSNTMEFETTELKDEQFEKNDMESRDAIADGSINSDSLESIEENADFVDNLIYVHICGEVTNPGVYEMNYGDRLFILVEKAGGFTVDAAVDYMNQAMIVGDGERIYIPSNSEVIELGISLSENSSVTKSVSESEKDKGLVDLNNASEDDLMTLPGIGSAKAKKIIAYREQIGKFSKPEQLMDITGIKEGVYKKIKDYVIVR